MENFNLSVMTTLESFEALTMEQLKQLFPIASTFSKSQRNYWMKAIDKKEAAQKKADKEALAKIEEEAKAKEEALLIEVYKDEKSDFQTCVRVTNDKFGLLESGKPKSKWLTPENEHLTAIAKAFVIGGNVAFEDAVINAAKEIETNRKASKEAAKKDLKAA